MEHMVMTSQAFEVILALTCGHFTQVVVFPLSPEFGVLILLPRKSAYVCHPIHVSLLHISPHFYVPFQDKRENVHCPCLQY